MKYKNIMAAVVLCVLAGAPFAAHADALRGYTNASANLLAGPGRDYPAVAHVADNANVDIFGCVNGFKWCDVAWNGNRGWIDGRFLDSVYRDRHVNIIEYGPQSDVPVVTFEQKSYWNDYYHDRPFYTEERYWHTETTH